MSKRSCLLAIRFSLGYDLRTVLFFKTFPNEFFSAMMNHEMSDNMSDNNMNNDNNAVDSQINATSIVGASEETLVVLAQTAVSQCNWTVGECASEWTQKYAKGRTDADFAAKVGLSTDQIYQRRRVSETFGAIRDQFPSLKWSHFYASLTWDDALDALKWSEENQLTVKSMRAWKRSHIDGEDLTESAQSTEPFDGFAGDPDIVFVSQQLDEVRDPDDWNEAEQRAYSSADVENGAMTVSSAAREAMGENDAEYVPFRSDAGSPGPNSTEGGATSTAVKSPIAPEQVAKRAVSALERINNALTSEILAEFGSLPPKLRDRFTQAIAELSSKVDSLS